MKKFLPFLPLLIFASSIINVSAEETPVNSYSNVNPAIDITVSETLEIHQNSNSNDLIINDLYIRNNSSVDAIKITNVDVTTINGWSLIGDEITDWAKLPMNSKKAFLSYNNFNLSSSYIEETLVNPVDEINLSLTGKAGATTTKYEEQIANIVMTISNQYNYYNISYDLDGGTLDNPKIVYSTGENVILSTPYKAGYIFLGWELINWDLNVPGDYIWSWSPGGLSDYVSEGDLTFKAVWYEITYNVVLDPTGGTVSQEIIKVKENEAVGTLPVPILEGYVFAGWLTDENGEGEKYTKDTIVTRNICLYAHWVPAGTKYTVSFYAFGEEWEVLYPVAGSKLSMTEVLYDIFDWLYSDYTLEGWYTDETYTTEWFFDTDIVTKNMVLYAKVAYKG